MLGCHDVTDNFFCLLMSFWRCDVKFLGRKIFRYKTKFRSPSTMRREAGTTTQSHGSCLEETVEDRYNRCGLLNIIQHIDIFGKFRSNYVMQRTNWVDAFVCVSSKSSSRCSEDSSVSSIRDVESKLSRFSVSTKVSGLYPGHDILGRKANKAKLSTRSNVTFGALVPRWIWSVIWSLWSKVLSW